LPLQFGGVVVVEVVVVTVVVDVVHALQLAGHFAV